VHNADMMRYYMGEVGQVYARTALWEQTRFRPEGTSSTSGFYAHWQGEMPGSIEATAEDTLVAAIDFSSGAIGEWTQSYAGHGRGYGHRAIYGSQGALRPGGTRNGASPLLTLDDGSELTGSALLDLVPGYNLDGAAAALFGTERPASYDLTFPEADRKLLALEYHELGECILQGKMPEVDGLAGRRAVALCYAALESGLLNRPVTLDEIEAEETGAYEAEINAHLGL
jgi:predicted dehydrogenase